MMPCPSDEQLEGLLSEQLASPERDAIEAHVEECGHCQQEIERLLNETALPGVRRVHEARSQTRATQGFVPQLHDAPCPPELVVQAAPLSLPVLPGYEVLEEIGRGGMGVVYRACHLALNRVVAVKMILATSHTDADARRRFKAEAEAAARLQHPHIVPIYEVNEAEGRAYFALEFCGGGSLAKHLDGTPWPALRAAELLETLARAVEAAHQAQVVHRDLKPANILLTAEGQAKITDFGLAKKLGEVGQTQTGQVLGTPCYMAPEQAAGKKEVGPAADVYALGAILYELLTGRPPFRGETQMDTVLQVLNIEAVAVRRLQPQAPRDLETICHKCLHKDPKQRYATALDLAEELRRFRTGEPILARPAGTMERAAKWARRRPAIAALLAGLLAVTVLGFAAVLWQWRQTQEALVKEADAHQDSDQARQAEAAAHERTERLLYFHKINLSHREWQAWNIAQAERLLNECREDLRHWEWRYLKRLCHADLGTLIEHDTMVVALAFSPDGQWLASAGSNWSSTAPGEIKLCRADTGKHCFTLRGHSGPLLDLAFSPDSRWLASCSVSVTREPPRVKLWDVPSCAEVPMPADFGVAGNGVAFHPDGKTLASAGSDGAVRLWDIPSGKLRHTLPGPHRRSARKVAFSPNGNLVASVGRDGTARIWDPARPGPPIVLAMENAPPEPATETDAYDVRCLAFSPDGRQLAVGGKDRTLRIWEVGSFTKKVAWLGHGSAINSLQFSATGDALASADGMGMILIWEVAGSRVTRTLRGHTGGVHGLAFRRDGRLASASEDRTVKLWDVTAPQEWRVPQGSAGGAESLAYSPTGKHWAAGSPRLLTNGWTVRLWETDADRPPRLLQGHTAWVSAVAFSPDGRFLASASMDRTVRIWPVTDDSPVRLLNKHGAGVRGVAWSPDGKTLATAGDDKTIILWDTVSGRDLFALRGHGGTIACVTFSPDGLHLASASGDQSVILWDLQSRAAERTLHPEARPMHGASGYDSSVLFTLDGQHLITAGGDDKIRIWDLTEGFGHLTHPARILLGHREVVSCLAISRDSRRLASGSVDATVKIWDIGSGQEALTLRGHNSTPTSVAFSSDGRRLVSSGLETLIWEGMAEATDAAAPAVGGK
jgi:WD40 repeat protein